MRFFSLVSLTLATLGSFAQSESFKVSWFDKTKSTEEKELLMCEGCALSFISAQIPELHLSSSTIPEGQAIQAVLSQMSWEDLPSGFYPFFKDFDSTEPLVTASKKKGGKDVFSSATIVPFRRVGSKIQRLTEFQITFETSVKPGGNSKQWMRKTGASVLAEGEWYKIATARDGVYKITHSDLQAMGINTAQIDPTKINIYGNGGEQLPYPNSEFRYDDLVLNPSFVSGENDGKFDSGDFIMFYAKGPVSWSRNGNSLPVQFTHSKNIFSDSAYYFIRVNDGVGSRIQDIDYSSEQHDQVVSTFHDYQLQELDNINLLFSGRQYFGDVFTFNTNQSFNFSFPLMTNDQAIMKAGTAIRSNGAPSDFNISTGGQSILLSGQTSSCPTCSVAILQNGQTNFTPSGNTVSVNAQFIKGTTAAEGWLDYIAVNVTRELKYPGQTQIFRNALVADGGSMARYEVGQFNQGLQVWNVSDLTSVKNVALQISGNIGSFNYPSIELEEFVMFSINNALSIRTVGKVENQNLHALKDVDLIIVCPETFKSAADELAQIHTDRGLTVEIVSPNAVYNEFSSGNRDVTAIKMLMKMLYDKSLAGQSTAPKYLLLFGDGTFDNKKGLQNNKNFVITYQSFNSTSPTDSYVSDDYFGLLDDNESESINDKLDIGVGRIPVNTLSEAQAMVQKIRNYLALNGGVDPEAHCLTDNVNPFGPWRNRLVFVSDDQDGSVLENIIHMSQSNGYSNIVRNNHPAYDIVKIYMDAYQQISTPGGQRYPQGQEDIRRNVQNGALIVNYVGHGGERGWAHERILDIPTIKAWTNGNKLPLFVTATCELARFDDPAFVSAGEHIIMNQNGGAIGMLTTTRIVYSQPNDILTTAFYNVALDDNLYSPLALGDMARMTKNTPGVNSTNSRNFTLLGDPAVALAYPKSEVYTSELNGVPITEMQTIKALEEVTVRGYVGDADGQILSDFNGVVYPTVFDKSATVQVLNNDGGSQYSFDSFRNIIYKGKASVTNGEFTFSFMVPRDISFTTGAGRISYYAVENAGSQDAHGFFESFQIGGTNQDAVADSQGPNVKVFMNDENFVFGGITNENPILIAKFFDENGINTVGSGIGHDITAILNDKSQESISLNDFFEADLDTYKSGSIQYQLSKLPEGTHKVSVKGWDVHNNSSTESTEFVVALSAEMALEHVLNYPNPFTTRTQFFFEHNQNCQSLDVRIQVFTVSGKLVKTINKTVLTAGYRSEGIEWDGKDDFGDNIGKGVYVYRVSATTPEGKSAEKFEKLVILK